MADRPLLLGGLALTLTAALSPVGAATITGFDLDVSAFSPNGDGTLDSLRVSLQYASNATTLDSVSFVLMRNDTDTLSVFMETDVPVESSVEWTWDGTDVEGAPVPDGVYDLSARIADADDADEARSPIAVDRLGPMFLSADVTGPAGAFADGDYVQVRATFSETPDSLWLDVTGLDDDLDQRATQRFEVVADGVLALLYRISESNGTADGVIPLALTAWDSLGTAASFSGLEVCLSNVPPLPGDAVLVGAAGDSLPPDFTFATGDTIRVLACFPAAFVFDSLSTYAYAANYSGVDTEFNPVLNPAILEAEFVTALPDSEVTLPHYPGLACVRFAYELSADNRTPEGTYDVFVEARDAGCGLASASVAVTIADLGPDAPELDPLAAESTNARTLTLTGTAPGAALVEIVDADRGSLAAEAVPDPVAGAFAVEVSVDDGLNRWFAVAYDDFRHASPESNVLEVWFASTLTLRLPHRFYPGDEIELTAIEPVDGYELEIYNLAGDSVHRATASDPGEVHVFAWDGRNRAGRSVGTGAYVARVLVRGSSGTREITRAFVFTRK